MKRVNFGSVFKLVNVLWHDFAPRIEQQARTLEFPAQTQMALLTFCLQNIPPYGGLKKQDVC